MKNAYLPKEKESNKVYQIKKVIWEVSNWFSWVSIEAKYEGYIPKNF